MTETNCFSALGRDLPQMCKPDPVSWTLCRDVISYFQRIPKWSLNNTRGFFFKAKLYLDGLTCMDFVCVISNVTFSLSVVINLL